MLSAVGRVVPALFASSYAAELADFVLEEVLERDLSTCVLRLLSCAVCAVHAVGSA